MPCNWAGLQSGFKGLWTSKFHDAAVLAQTLPHLGDVPPEARLNLVIHHLRHGEVGEAFNLIKDLEPTTPQEYILKVCTQGCSLLHIYLCTLGYALQGYFPRRGGGLEKELEQEKFQFQNT